ncbi:MAG: hypothetical protein AAF443_03125 [Chlamydiota bacterium]
MSKKKLEQLLDELVAYQEKKLLNCGSAIVPRITADDILQPNDYPELENHPYFRYEEGVLKGIQEARMAILAWQRDQ